MYPLELIQTVRLITDVCLEVAPKESVLCITDRQENMDVMGLIAAECRARGAEAAVILLDRRKHHHHEPPPPIAQAMKDADVVITMAFGALMHTRARKEACAAGVKYVSMGTATKEYLAGLDLKKEDLEEVRRLTERIAQHLTEASSARVTTAAGTDLHMSLKGRKGLSLVPFAKKGSFCVVPDYAEAPCPPVEDSVEGVAVIDGDGWNSGPRRGSGGTFYRPL